MILPNTEDSPLIRTDFSDDAAWLRVVQAAAQLSPEGFRAYFDIVDDSSFENADPVRLARMAGDYNRHALIFVADTATMRSPEMPLLCVETEPPGTSFRVVPGCLNTVENNLSIANMDFCEFADAVDPDGVFRGFADKK